MLIMKRQIITTGTMIVKNRVEETLPKMDLTHSAMRYQNSGRKEVRQTC